MTAAATLLPAASLILMRDHPTGVPEILAVRRGEMLAFAAGAYVFPGGRVDPADVAAALRLGVDDPAEWAARIAAVRETQEETGIADAADIADLVPFARWRPPSEAPRRFDTRFYLAQARDDAAAPVPDGTESSEAFWTSAQALLDDCAAGRGHAIFPTRRLLERLAQFAGFGEARAQAVRLSARIIEPWIEQRPDGAWLCIPADAGYPVTAEPIGRTARF
jgi:8-oxo-dGTP pyrophosphatase MutT (NUDIX family)